MTITTTITDVIELYRTRRNLEWEIDFSQHILNSIEMELAPAEGWPGKNEEARAIARAKVLMEHAEYLHQRDTLNEKRTQLADITGRIEAYEAEVKAQYLDIRRRYVEHLERNAISRDDALMGVV